MKLNETMVRDILSKPINQNLINDVKLEESQLRVYTEEMSEAELKSEPYWNNLLKIMAKRSDKKFKRVLDFARYPLPVVQMSDSILNDVFKVFEGKNRYFNTEAGRNIEGLETWIDQFAPEKWIEDHARKVFKNKPNSFVVVDVDQRGIPYLVYIDSSRIVDAKFKDKEGSLEYIAFIHSQKKHETKADVITTLYSVYDDSTFYVYSKDSDSDEFIEVSSNAHNVGYCPARSFISQQTNEKNPFKKRVVFSPALSRFEDWSLFDIFQNYSDHYVPFPVTEAPVRKCVNPECKGGKIETEVIDDVKTGASHLVYSECGACGGGDHGEHIYPGTHIGIKVQADKNANDGSGVFRMIFPDTANMKHIPEKLQNLEKEIRFNSVGLNTITNSEAVNEMQMKGSFNSMESVLLRFKSELDHLYSFVVKTAGRLIYGNIEIRVEANFGTEFYLLSEEEIQKRFETAKKIGLPSEEQLNIYKQLIQTKYKGNTEKMNRELMLLDLDPFPMFSIDECIKLKNESVLDDFQLSLKVNFLKFISKFESENILITQFGLVLPYWTRIELIEKSLYLYNEELIEEKNVRNNPGAGNNDEDKPQVTQEQIEAQANLRGSVGGVQGILAIQLQVSQGVTQYESAISTMIEIYGFSRETSIAILGTPGKLKEGVEPEIENQIN